MASDKDNDTGRVNAVWPGSALHFQAVLEKPRWEDFDIKYLNVSQASATRHTHADERQTKNQWAFLGRGFTMAERHPGLDLAPYLKLEYLDDRFYEANGFTKNEEPAPVLVNGHAANEVLINGEKLQSIVEVKTVEPDLTQEDNKLPNNTGGGFTNFWT